MTVGFYPAFDRKLGVTFAGDGASLFHHAALLDALCEQRGVRVLTSFTDERDPPPDFDGYPEELHEALGPWNEWFDAGEGIACVDGLLAALLADDLAIGERLGPAVEGVTADLTALREVLREAARRGARFRLVIT